MFLIAGFILFLALVSYHPLDRSLNTVAGFAHPVNMMGAVGAWFADLLLQTVGLAAYTLPGLILLLGWKWVRSSPIDAPWVKTIGALLWALATCTALGMLQDWRPIAGVVPAGGILGLLTADALVNAMNVPGALLVTLAVWVASLYMVSTFEMSRIPGWVMAPFAWTRAITAKYRGWREQQAERAREKAAERAARRAAQEHAEQILAQTNPVIASEIAATGMPPIVDPLQPLAPAMKASAAAAGAPASRRSKAADLPPWETARQGASPLIEDIPIRELEPPKPQETVGPKEDPEPADVRRDPSAPRQRTEFKKPPTYLLQEPAARTAWDSQELKDTALQIKAKFEEFNVRGSVTQINPGPV
ncbi:MAG: DNA translocase FtsK 4TM domain-containing protein, partial [Acidobacteriota bacterium]